MAIKGIFTGDLGTSAKRAEQKINEILVELKDSHVKMSKQKTDNLTKIQSLNAENSLIDDASGRVLKMIDSLSGVIE